MKKKNAPTTWNKIVISKEYCSDRYSTSSVSKLIVDEIEQSVVFSFKYAAILLKVCFFCWVVRLLLKASDICNR